MIYISSRKSLWDAEHFSDSFIVFSNNDAQRDIGYHDFSFLKQKIAGKKVLILVHGFNCDKLFTLQDYSHIEQSHKEYWGTYDVVLGYIWPGAEKKRRYWSSLKRINRSADNFSYLLEYLIGGAASLGIWGHSMGCKVALKGLMYIQTKTKIKKCPIELILTAAALSSYCLEKGNDYFGVTQFVNKTYIFYARGDKILRYFYRLLHCGPALGASGPHNKGALAGNVYSINCDNVIDSHVGYSYSKSVFVFLKGNWGMSDTPPYTLLCS